MYSLQSMARSQTAIIISNIFSQKRMETLQQYTELMVAQVKKSAL